LRKTSILPLAVLAAATLLACDDTTGPGFRDVPEEASETTIFDFRSSSVRDPSAFDIVGVGPVRTDQSAGWDFLFALQPDGTAQLRPRNQVLGGGAASGLQPVESEFGDLDEAPEGGYVTGSVVAVEEGDVLAGRSRQDPSFGIGCRHFMKMEVLTVDRDAGTITFRHLVNPACDRRNLVPGSSNRD
jgi:hypothetical protein